jgi:hypothetical protein
MTRPEVFHEPKPGYLPNIVPEVHEELGQPCGIVPYVQPTDQRGAVGVGPLERIEQLAGATLAEGRNHSLADPFLTPHIIGRGEALLRQHPCFRVINVSEQNI